MPGFHSDCGWPVDWEGTDANEVYKAVEINETIEVPGPEPDIEAVETEEEAGEEEVEETAAESEESVDAETELTEETNEEE